MNKFFLIGWIFSAALLLTAGTVPPEVKSRMQELNPRFDHFDADPAFIMPVGSGDLTALAGFGSGIELQLGKTDFFGHEPVKYHYSPLPLSPGRIRLFPELGPEQLTSFRQTLDLYRGCLRYELGTAEGVIHVTLRGVMGENTLLIEVEDRRPAPAPPSLAYLNHRNPQQLKIQNGRILCRETNLLRSNRTPLPEGKKPSPTDLIYGRTLHLAIALEQAPLLPATAHSHQLRTRAANGMRNYRFFVTAAVTPFGESCDILALQNRVVQTPELSAKQEAWWENFWSKSFLVLRGDADADYLNTLWFVNLYSLGLVHSGKFPPRFSGGLGTVRDDQRSWGHGFWFQNQRQISWPLGAANHLEMWRVQLDFYDSFFDYRQQETTKIGKEGIFFPEWLPARVREKPERKITPVTPELLAKPLDLRLESRKGGYTGHIYSAGAEWIVLMEDYLCYSGDARFVREVFSPWLHEITLFFVRFLKKGEDGLYHMEPADAIEQFRKVRDPAPDLAGVRAVFDAAQKYGPAFGFEPLLLEAVRERLAHLPELPRGFQVKARKQQAVVVPADVYAPLREFLEDKGSWNQENPELYSVYPFALIDAHSSPAEYERMVRTFRMRNYPNRAGWSQCGVQAARLQLPETVKIVLDHAKRHQRYPYGGWNSPGKKLSGSRFDVSDAPYLDALGVNTTALQEMLLQSHAGKVELLPAVPEKWSGRFRLRARDGFLYDVEFAPGRKVQSRRRERVAPGTGPAAAPSGSSAAGTPRAEAPAEAGSA